jgi:hypothetical protein
MTDKIEKIKERLEKAEISFEEIIPDDPEFSSRMIFEIPAQRVKHEYILIYRDEIVEQAFECNFENYRFVRSYESIWSKSNNTIEAEVGNVDSPSRFFFDRLNRIINKPEETDDDEDDDEITNIELPDIDGIKVSIGYSSKEFTFLTWSRSRGPRPRSARRITLKLENVNVNTHDSAKEILERIANSLFFQIDIAFELPINLQAQRENWTERRKKRMRRWNWVATKN